MTRWPFYETGTNFLDARLSRIALAFISTKHGYPLGLRGRVVITSYLIVAASAVLLLVPALFYGSYPFSFPLGVINLLAVAGMILGPYFAVAGLIAKDNSVWVDVNRMLHGHISIPIVGGLVLFYNSVFVYAFVSIFLPVYLLFVVLATLITVMASRASGPSTTPSAPGPASSA